jgi:hypothetical protein
MHDNNDKDGDSDDNCRWELYEVLLQTSHTRRMQNELKRV